MSDIPGIRIEHRIACDTHITAGWNKILPDDLAVQAAALAQALLCENVRVERRTVTISEPVVVWRPGTETSPDEVVK